jgi:hypothetical protein
MKSIAQKAPPKKIRKAAKEKTAANKDKGKSYDAYKTFDGKQYTGMQVGRSHKWNYDAGVWKERKITPDKWEISYAVTKRRAGHAPEGSGVPVGTGYHWFILSHQFVHKLNANDYSTAMIGLKLKLGHKRFDKEKWNIGETTKRHHLIQYLEDFIEGLKNEPESFDTISLEFNFKGALYTGYAVPMMESCHSGKCTDYDIILNDKNMGIIRFKDKWRMTNVKPQAFVNAIGEQLMMKTDKEKI